MESFCDTVAHYSVGAQFIYISVEEMEAVAAFIKRRGRIAIGELAAKSDELIDLEHKQVALPPGMLPELDFSEVETLVGVEIAV